MVMKVKELIAQLQGLNPEAEVFDYSDIPIGGYIVDGPETSTLEELKRLATRVTLYPPRVLTPQEIASRIHSSLGQIIHCKSNWSEK
jgi:hypothetical protein